MKKALLLLSASALVLTFTSCGGGNKEGEAQTTTPEAEAKKEKPHANLKVESTATGKLTDFARAADIKLNSITMDFWPSKSTDLRDPREDGKQFVRVEFTITTTSKEPYGFNYSAYSIESARTPSTRVSLHIGDDNVSDSDSKTQDLLTGKPFTNALYFEADTADKVEDITFTIECNDKNGKSVRTELKAK